MSTYRTILRSTSILGGSAFLTVLIGLVRTKLVAVLLGPGGIGLIGLLQSLLGAASALAGLGLGSSGTRHIAAAAGKGDEESIALLRRALLWGALVLSLAGVAFIWLLRRELARYVLGDESLSEEVGWMAIGVGLTVGTMSTGAVLNGLRRIGDLARLGVWSALLGTAAGICALLLFERSGVALYVLSAPLASFLLGQMYLARVLKVSTGRHSFQQVVHSCFSLARLGGAFVVVGLVGSAAQLFVRSLLQREIGSEELGQFQAAWSISLTYIGFVFQAMGTDYYPRLTNSIDDHIASTQIVNEQAEAGLLLAGPVLISLLALAPWVTVLLYSREFAAGANVLQWLVLADVVKLASWPLGFVVMAVGASRPLVLFECFSYAVLLGVTWIALPLAGIEAPGIATLLMQLAYLPIVMQYAKYRISFVWHTRTVLHFLVLLALASAVLMVARHDNFAGAFAGSITAAGLSVYAFLRLRTVAFPGGWSPLR